MSGDNDWFALAACHDQPSELFYPTRGEDIEPARAVCAGCMVREECLEYALRLHIMHGVFGGKSERERRHIRETRRKRVSA